MLTPIVRAFCHLYPLKSGCGSIANSKLFRKLDNVGDPDIWVSIKGGKALVPANDFVARSLNFFGQLDPKISWVVNRTLSKGDTAIDVGANLGSVTLHMASRVGDGGRVIAFEPQPKLCEYLRATLNKNELPQVELMQMGLGAEKDTLQLTVPHDNAGAATLTASIKNAKERFDVPVDRMDTVAQTLGLGPIALVKIDVEGFESKVLQGAETLLSKAPQPVVLFEEHSAVKGKIPASFKLLLDLGYSLYGLPRSLLSVRLQKVEPGVSIDAHDYVAISDNASAATRKRLGIA